MISVILPVHNEADVLPLTLPQLYRLQPDEVILLLDRCTDASEAIVRAVADRYPRTDSRIEVLRCKVAPTWRFYPAQLRRRGYRGASYDTILTMSADHYLDPHVVTYIARHLQNNVKLLSLGVIDYPFTWQNLWGRVISRIHPTPFRGFCAFSKAAWEDTEDLESVSRIPCAEDTHLVQAIHSKYATRFCETRTLHLRPREDALRHYRKGIAYHAVVQEPSLARMLARSLLMVRPHLVVGYCHARNGDVK